MKKIHIKESGITIITLVITIIILLILAGISIATLVGNEGLINKAKKAAKDYGNAQDSELTDIEKFANAVENLGENDGDEDQNTENSGENNGDNGQNPETSEMTKLASEMQEMKKQIEELKNTATTSTTIDKVYPIGSIYMSVNQTNPSELFGGTWVTWGSGRVPVGVNSADGDFNTVEKIGGEKTHTLTISEMPAHNHSITAEGITRYELLADIGLTNNEWGVHWQTSEGFRANKGTMNNTGGNAPHNNLQPYITCYMWKRVN